MRRTKIESLHDALRSIHRWCAVVCLIFLMAERLMTGVAGARLRRARRLTLGFAAVLLPFLVNLLLVGSAQADTPKASKVHRTTASILALPPEQTSHSEPAALHGVITQTAGTGFVVQDRTAGIWVYWDRSEDFTPGDDVEIKGYVEPGLYAPVVRGTSVRKLGRAPLPKPKRVTFQQLSTGKEECRYVSVTGTVRSIGIQKGAMRDQKLRLKIAMEDGFVNATFPMEDAPAAARLIDAVVRITATAMCTKNKNRQITAATLSALGMGDVTVLRPPPPNLFAKPLTPIGRLMQYRSGTDYSHRVRVAGTTTYYKPGESLILEDGGNALFVMTTQTSDIRLGDRVEALGFPAPRDSGPILQDAILRRTAAGRPLQPAAVRIADICSGTLNYNLISTEGQLLRRVREPSREVLLLQDDANIVLAELAQSDTSNIQEGLEEGSMVRISGISVLEIEGSWNYGTNSATAVRCKLLLRSPDDVHVIAPPSWWTTRHLFYIAAALESWRFFSSAMWYIAG